MKKITLVINGKGGVGKDTLCDLAARHMKVLNLSSIMPIKDIAKMCGWDGRKEAKDRKFLSDLKRLCIEYNDYPTVWATERYREFLASDYDVFFMHIREPEEIGKFVRATGGDAKTLLVRGGSRMPDTGEYGNSSDDGVEKYSYDYYFTNEKTLEEAERDFTALIKKITEE